MNVYNNKISVELSMFVLVFHYEIYLIFNLFIHFYICTNDDNNSEVIIFSTPFTFSQLYQEKCNGLASIDFRYWEDQSDEYKGREGSLLPLWKFSCSTLSTQCSSTATAAAAASAQASGAVGASGMLRVRWFVPLY